MRKILITGGNGFIGRNLKDNLSKFYIICAPSRRKLDLTNTEETRLFLEKQSFDTVIHCANTNNTRYGVEKVTDYDILCRNLRMYWNLARCDDLYRRMIYFGSGAEYDSENYIPNMTEDYFGTHIPKDAYGFSKYLMNQDARKSKKIYNLRLFGVYGKYEEWNRRFISNNICRVLCGKDISINQDMFFDYLYIKDLCDIVKWFIENTPKYHDYNVCSGKSIRLSEIAAILQQECACELPICVKKRREKLPYTASNRRMLREIGMWKFTDLYIGVKEMCIFYQKEYMSNTDFYKQVNVFFD